MRHQAELKRVFERIDPKPFPKERHLMPVSLRTIKELGAAGIDWRGIHIIDAFSLVCSLRIDNARIWLRHRAQEKMTKAGIRRITPATQADFDAL